MLTPLWSVAQLGESTANEQTNAMEVAIVRGFRLATGTAWQRNEADL